MSEHKGEYCMEKRTDSMSLLKTLLREKKGIRASCKQSSDIFCILKVGQKSFLWQSAHHSHQMRGLFSRISWACQQVEMEAQQKRAKTFNIAVKSHSTQLKKNNAVPSLLRIHSPAIGGFSCISNNPVHTPKLTLIKSK